jgi:hypothetical protein
VGTLEHTLVSPFQEPTWQGFHQLCTKGCNTCWSISLRHLHVVDSLSIELGLSVEVMAIGRYIKDWPHRLVFRLCLFSSLTFFKHLQEFLSHPWRSVGQLLGFSQLLLSYLSLRSILSDHSFLLVDSQPAWKLGDYSSVTLLPRLLLEHKVLWSVVLSDRRATFLEIVERCGTLVELGIVHCHPHILLNQKFWSSNGSSGSDRSLLVIFCS